MNKTAILSMMLGLFVITSCIKQRPVEVYHPFEDKSWQRFDILTFEVPVAAAGKTYDVLFFTRLTPQFPYDDLTINMIMNTPSGEERIGEYTLKIKTTGGAQMGECKGDSCESSLLLTRGLYCSEPGVLKIEIENLTPRMQTAGILGAGIRLMKTRK